MKTTLKKVRIENFQFFISSVRYDPVEWTSACYYSTRWGHDISFPLQSTLTSVFNPRSSIWSSFKQSIVSVLMNEVGKKILNNMTHTKLTKQNISYSHGFIDQNSMNNLWAQCDLNKSDENKKRRNFVCFWQTKLVFNSYNIWVNIVWAKFLKRKQKGFIDEMLINSNRS